MAKSQVSVSVSATGSNSCNVSLRLKQGGKRVVSLIIESRYRILGEIPGVCVYVIMYVCECVIMNVSICACANKYLSVLRLSLSYSCVLMYIRACLYMCLFVCVCISVCVCVCVCVAGLPRGVEQNSHRSV